MSSVTHVYVTLQYTMSFQVASHELFVGKTAPSSIIPAPSQTRPIAVRDFMNLWPK